MSTLTPENAADVVSETFLTAWRRFDDVPPGDESRLWLYGVAHRVLANHHRGERRRDALVERLSAEIGELDLGWHDPLPSDLPPWRRPGIGCAPKTAICWAWWPGKA